MAQYFGVSQPHICEWEAGTRVPTNLALQNLTALAKCREARIVMDVLQHASSRRRKVTSEAEIAIAPHNLDTTPATAGVKPSPKTSCLATPQVSPKHNKTARSTGIRTVERQLNGGAEI